MVLEQYENLLLGDIVTEDFRTAEILLNNGLDFCCGGKKSLGEACKEKKLDVQSVIKELNELESSQPGIHHNFKEWKLDFLMEYIVNTHHKYIQKNLPQLIYYTRKIATVHSSHHPELVEVEDLFNKISTELLQHMRHEELSLFPAINEVIKTNSAKAREMIFTEITRMTGEHEFAGGSMDRINQITSNYHVPFDGCNTYHLTFKLLKQFEDDLHIHVHLENNILFPKALRL